MKLSAFLYLFLIGSGVLFGQASELPSLPPGPLLKRAPEFSTWTIVFQSGAVADVKKEGVKSDSLKANSSRRIEIKKTGKVIFEKIVDSRGKNYEIWHDNGIQFLVLNDGNLSVYPDFGGKDIYTPNYAVSDFAGLEWISPATYAGIQKMMGRDSIVFKGSVSMLASDERGERELEANRTTLRASAEAHANGVSQKPSPNPLLHAMVPAMVPAIAYIDLESRLPLAVTFGEETRIYQFGAPPTSVLTLPPILAAAQADFQDRIQRLSRPSAQP